MQDDQWNYPPKRGSNERPRPGGGNSGPLPGQRPGASRPATGSPTNGRPTGNPNYSNMGQSSMNNNRESRPLQRPTSGSMSSNDGWNQSPQQRRGPSGPINTGSAGRASGSGYNTRTSRSLTPPTGRPAVGGRGQSGQWGNSSRDWEDDEDEWNPRQQRSPSGKQASGGRKQPQARKGTTVRGDWVIDTEAKYKTPTNSLRVRLLLLLLLVVIVVGGAIYFVPSARSRLLAYLPGSKGSTAAPVTGGSGNLTLQVNAPSAKVTLDTKSYNTAAGQTAPFSSVSIPGLASGNHTISIQATNFTDFTGQLQMPATNTTMTAWLAPTADQLTALSAPLSKPATQPDAGVAGDHYNTTSKATGKITISISYTLSGLTATSFTGQIVASADTKNIPFKPAALTLTPVITFKNAAGTQLYQYKPKALQASQFALQVPLGFDAKGAPQFGPPTVALPSNVSTSFTGPAKNDYALYFALVSILPNTTNALSFKCAGAVDKKNFNPEDGLQITEAGGAHYFYRWGTIWATNDVAFTLTPKAPHALPTYNEFTDANTAHANASCGS